MGSHGHLLLGFGAFLRVHVLFREMVYLPALSQPLQIWPALKWVTIPSTIILVCSFHQGDLHSDTVPVFLLLWFLGRRRGDTR